MQSRRLIKHINRHLHLQEWQGKQLLSKHRIPVQPFKVITHADHIEGALGDVAWETVVVKAQCDAGGRGKGMFVESGLSGVKVLHDSPSLGEIKRTVSGMLHDRLVTAQTGKDGVLIEKVMVVEGRRELGAERYLAMILDRAHKQPMVMVSHHGGMAVEQHGDDVQLCTVDDTETVARALGVEKEVAGRLVMRLHDLFVHNDAIMVEINPLCITAGEEPLAVDAKITIDDNALFRHTGKYDQDSHVEHNYIKLDGGGEERSVGCMVNGAGLAMATMDMLGTSACNFLDVGGTATPASIRAAFALLLSDERVTKIFVNVFGGIVRCDVIADGIKQALSDPHIYATLKQRVSRIVVRLAGTNAEEGLRALRGVEMVVPCGDLKTAAALAVADLGFGAALAC